MNLFWDVIDLLSALFRGVVGMTISIAPALLAFYAENFWLLLGLLISYPLGTAILTNKGNTP